MMSSLADALWRLELDLLSAETRARPERVAALLAEDFQEFGRSGARYLKAETISALAEEDPSPVWRLEVTECAVKPLAADVALVTYRTARRFPDGSVDRAALRASIWRREEGDWRMVFHQATPTG